MNDVALLRTNREVLAEAFRRRKVEVDLDALAELDERRRRVRSSAENLRSRQKKAGEEIAALEGDAKEAAIAEMSGLAEDYRAALAEADQLDTDFDEIWVPLPNPAHESVPVGDTDADNLEIKKWGEPPEFDFESLDHVDIGERLGIIDIERAVKVSGSRFAYLMGQAVMLEFALVQWTLGQLVAEGFTPVVPPVLVREMALFGTGFLPGAREQAYAVGVSDGESIESDDLFLAATAEIPLAAMYSDEILDAADLPMRFAGFSTCFRREAGTYGKDTRGIFRVHQFDKVEMFSYCHPDKSWAEHEHLLSLEESLVQELGIPYRVVNVSTGDLGDSAAKKYDIEAWFPGQDAYREITSCSNTTDYQARRLKIRFRDGDGPTAIAHTLNGTAIAVGRTLVAILENNQRADGSVVIPEPLRASMGSDVITS
ncbi:MAG: serine--tRNA ligase [Acidimicrobiia bacterium]